MKILHYKLLKDFWKKHKDSEYSLKRWVEIIEHSNWNTHNDLKKDFPSADYVGNNRYVFNISGNKYRLITMVIFYEGYLYIRFVGTHAEYDKIKDIKII